MLSGNTAHVMFSLAVTHVLYKHRVGEAREKLMIKIKGSRAQLKQTQILLDNAT